MHGQVVRIVLAVQGMPSRRAQRPRCQPPSRTLNPDLVVEGLQVQILRENPIRTLNLEVRARMDVGFRASRHVLVHGLSCLLDIAPNCGQHLLEAGRGAEDRSVPQEHAIQHLLPKTRVLGLRV